MFVEVVNSGTAFAVPPVVVTSDEVAGDAEEDDADEGEADAIAALFTLLPLTGGAANTNAEGGNPPTVSASPAFNAYGALTSNTRGCSVCPETCTPTQRACSELNRSAGRPSGLVEPSRAT